MGRLAAYATLDSLHNYESDREVMLIPEKYDYRQLQVQLGGLDQRMHACLTETHKARLHFNQQGHLLFQVKSLANALLGCSFLATLWSIDGAAK